MLIYLGKLDYKYRLAYSSKKGGKIGLQLTNAEAKVMKIIWRAQQTELFDGSMTRLLSARRQVAKLAK